MHMRRGNHAAVTAALVVVFALPSIVRADTANFELNGKIYTKYLYKNDDTRGCLNLSNPFWPDNIGGGNGVCSEFELNIRGRVSKYVSTGVRLKSRFGALWQNWWENGDVRWDFPEDQTFVENNSGESLGQNHAQNIKLRGAFIRAQVPLEFVRWVHLGASDFSMFNEWTIGKSRYIDRDNGNGAFVEGDFLGGTLEYHVAAIALPKLYVGPGWNTGLANADELAGFWGQDWAFASKLQVNADNGLTFRGIGSIVTDWEADRNDPDLTGNADSDRGADHAVDLESRFFAANMTLEAEWLPPAFDWLSVKALLAGSYNKANEEEEILLEDGTTAIVPGYATNGVANDQGFSPVLFLRDEDGRPRGAQDFAGKVLIEAFDPFENGLSFKVEYFNIGQEFNAIFGARREADVLLTDGIIPSGFIQGGQLPTLNLANEFIDFDEPWYESIIGWHGGTGFVEYLAEALRINGEYTYITYNTNRQGRDVDSQYPDFLYTDGFTDPQAFTADQDYANVFDRGSDPRSVFKEFQNRRTHIAVINGQYQFSYGNGLNVDWKLKYINDFDKRRNRDEQRNEFVGDDYDGQLYLAYLFLEYQVNDEMEVGAGYEYQFWDEGNRSGVTGETTTTTEFFDYETTKQTARGSMRYTFGGLTFSWLMEYFYKDQDRNRPGSFDQKWNVWRSKLTAEAAW
ncbi:MAG: hypothetical protein AAGJ56_06535 [Myxococcota bacterium]